MSVNRPGDEVYRGRERSFSTSVSLSSVRTLCRRELALALSPVSEQRPRLLRPESARFYVSDSGIGPLGSFAGEWGTGPASVALCDRRVTRHRRRAPAESRGQSKPTKRTRPVDNRRAMFICLRRDCTATNLDQRRELLPAERKTRVSRGI